MARSFGIVEDKLREAEFFLSKFARSPYLSHEGHFYFSAFVSAARSVTLAMQASLAGHDEFEKWYHSKREFLRADERAPLFTEIRNEVLHVGTNPVDIVPPEHLRAFFSRSLIGKRPKHVLVLPGSQKRDPTLLVDAVDTATRYFVCLVQVAFECYEKFKTLVDGQWYFTKESFRARGMDLSDALVELGFPETWLGEEPDEDTAWQILRKNQAGCLVNDIFYRHLGVTIASPDVTSVVR